MADVVITIGGTAYIINVAAFVGMIVGVILVIFVIPLLCCCFWCGWCCFRSRRKEPQPVQIYHTEQYQPQQSQQAVPQTHFIPDSTYIPPEDEHPPIPEGQRISPFVPTAITQAHESYFRPTNSNLNKPEPNPRVMKGTGVENRAFEDNQQTNAYQYDQRYKPLTQFGMGQNVYKYSYPNSNSPYSKSETRDAINHLGQSHYDIYQPRHSQLPQTNLPRQQ